MITYPEVGYVQHFTAELRENTAGLPPYPDENGHAVNYNEAMRAYALNATLLHDPWRHQEEVLEYGPSEVAEVLLVERAGGHGIIGSFSGVTGYIDTPHDPATLDPKTKKPMGPPDPKFDPIAHTLREEFETECGFTDSSFALVQFYAGKITVENRTIVQTVPPGSKINVVPILGLCAERPDISLNPKELASYKWTKLKAIKHTKDLSPGFFSTSLPSALTAIGVGEEAFRRLIR